MPSAAEECRKLSGNFRLSVEWSLCVNLTLFYRPKASTVCRTYIQMWFVYYVNIFVEMCI